MTTLALGFAWSYAGPFTFAWFSGVSWHIYVGAVLAPVVAWHAVVYTKRLPLAFWAERRWALRLAGHRGSRARLQSGRRRSVGVRAALGVGPPVHGLLRRGATVRLAVPGSYRGSTTGPPRLEPDSWRLSITGAVERPLSLGYSDLEASRDVRAVIDCTGGWYSEQSWSGVGLDELLDLVGPSADASSVTVRSATGYYRRFSMSEARSYILATHVGGQPLSRGHGFPARLVAPDKRGFEWVKWVAEIEVNDTSKWLQPPLPLQ